MLILNNATLAVNSSVAATTFSFDYNLGGFAVISNNHGEFVVAVANFVLLKTQLFVYQWMWNTTTYSTKQVTSFTNTTEYALYTIWAKYYPYAYYIGFEMVQTVYPYINERYIACVNQTDLSTTYVAKVITESINSTAYGSISYWECAENVTNTSIFRCIYQPLASGNFREFGVNMTDGTVVNNSMLTVITADGEYAYDFISITSITNNSVALFSRSQPSPLKVLEYLGKFGNISTVVTLYDVTDGFDHEIQAAGDYSGILLIFEYAKTPDLYWSTNVKLFSQNGTLLTTYSNLVVGGIPRFQMTFPDTTSETALIVSTQDQGVYNEAKAIVYAGRVDLAAIYQPSSAGRLVTLGACLIMFVLWIIA